MKRLIIVFTFVVFSFASLVQGAAVFKEDVVYSKFAGWRSLGGRLKMTRQGEVYHFELPIVFFGAGLFSRITFDEVKRVSRLKSWPQGAEQFFGSGEYELDKIPGMKERVLTMIAEIEEVYKTSFCDLKIVPVFVNERDLLNDDEVSENHNVYLANLNSAAKRYSDKARGLAPDQQAARTGGYCRSATVYLCCPNLLGSV